MELNNINVFRQGQTILRNKCKQLLARVLDGVLTGKSKKYGQHFRATLLKKLHTCVCNYTLQPISAK